MSNLVKLPDGRSLSFEEYGDKQGRAVIYFHGLCGSRLEMKRFHQIAATNNCRLISVDRPGMGESTLDRKRTVLSWVDDVLALADHLKVETFSVMGHSGGSPYVSACALKIPHRLRGAAIVSGMAPLEEPDSHVGMMKEQLTIYKLVKKFPFISSVMMYITRVMLKHSDKLLDKQIANLPDVDKKVFLDPVKRAQLITSSFEAFRNGIAGPALDMKLIFNPWGFHLSDIEFPVNIWHGSEDTQGPISHGKLHARLMRNSTLHEVKNEGHHSLILNHFGEIIHSL